LGLVAATVQPLGLAWWAGLNLWAASLHYAYDGLAHNARAAGRPAEAEAAYRDGLEQVPGAAAHFHFQLGRHYQGGGRPGLALEHLHEAVRLDPARFAAPARPLIGELRRSTPGCLLRSGDRSPMAPVP
jgi:tetratricopeptide (TPR) repeat protein